MTDMHELIQTYMKKYLPKREIARQDLFQLEAAGVLRRRKSGRKFVFEKCEPDHSSVSLQLQDG